MSILQNTESVNASLFLAAEQSPWTDVAKFIDLCSKKGVLVARGRRHNQTDGEVHYILSRGGCEYHLNANYWDCHQPEWQAALDWVLK